MEEEEDKEAEAEKEGKAEMVTAVGVEAGRFVEASV